MVRKKSSKLSYKITNMVASADIGLHLDLMRLAMELPELEYEPEQFPGGIFKMKDPKASFLIFKNGKVVCVGCKDEKTIAKALVKLQKTLRPYATKVVSKSKPNFTITNLVASSDLKKDVDLFALAMELPDVEYEPEQFPGAIIKLPDMRASVLLFKNGKVICAGAENKAMIEECLKRVKVLIDEHLKRRGL